MPLANTTSRSGRRYTKTDDDVAVRAELARFFDRTRALATPGAVAGVVLFAWLASDLVNRRVLLVWLALAAVPLGMLAAAALVPAIRRRRNALGQSPLSSSASLLNGLLWAAVP